MLARERCKVNGAHQSDSRAQGVTIHGTRFGVQGSGFGAHQSDSREQGVTIHGTGFGVQGSWFGARRSDSSAQGVTIHGTGLGFRAQGSVPAGLTPRVRG